MELPSNTIKLEAKDFTLDMHAVGYINADYIR